MTKLNQNQLDEILAKLIEKLTITGLAGDKEGHFMAAIEAKAAIYSYVEDRVVAELEKAQDNFKRLNGGAVNPYLHNRIALLKASSQTGDEE